MKAKSIQRRQQRKKQAEKVQEMRQHVTLARARQESLSGHPDLPNDPLGWCLGHGHITRPQYDAGRLFCRVYCRTYKKPFPACVSLETEKRGYSQEETVYDRECKMILDKMTKALRAFSRGSYDAVSNACVYERPVRTDSAIMNLRHGLELIEGMNSAKVAA